tara:strand:- start:182 stop:310 length:129 start_codon:yes stop_codon:yes gene_type:complete
LGGLIAHLKEGNSDTTSEGVKVVDISRNPLSMRLERSSSKLG